MKYLFGMYKKWEREIRSSINHSILKKKRKKKKRSVNHFLVVLDAVWV